MMLMKRREDAIAKGLVLDAKGKAVGDGSESVVAATVQTVKERLKAVQEKLLSEIEGRVAGRSLRQMDVDEIEKLLKAVRDGLRADAELEFADASRAIQVVVGWDMVEEGDEPPVVQ